MRTPEKLKSQILVKLTPPTLVNPINVSQMKQLGMLKNVPKKCTHIFCLMLACPNILCSVPSTIRPTEKNTVREVQLGDGYQKVIRRKVLC